MALLQPAGIRLYMGLLHYGEPLAIGLLVSTLLLATASGQAQESPIPLPEAVSRAVEAKLRTDPALAAAEFWATTRNGVVTLGGRTASLLAKESATRLAETVRGVRAVDNRLLVRPSGPSPAPGRLKEMVEQALATAQVLARFEIRVAANDGVVKLSGKVESAAEKQLADTLAMGVVGVVAMDNRLRVKPSLAYPDQEIARALRTRLRQDALVDDALIQVTVTGGRARLTGLVGSAAERRRAREDALLAGALVVDDQALDVARRVRDRKLRGDKYARRSPSALKQAILDVLYFDPRVDAGRITVEVDGGRAVLRGGVPTLRQKRLAEHHALEIVGVSEVDNRLEIEAASLSRAELTRQVQQALARNPFLDGKRIHLRMRKNGLSLTGEVASDFEKRQADAAIAALPGIADFRNDLRITGERQPLPNRPYVDEALGLAGGRMDDPAPQAGLADREIAEAIRKQLQWNPFLDPKRIELSVDNGVATLFGQVSSRLALTIATQNAYEGGARIVKNILAVKPLE